MRSATISPQLPRARQPVVLLSEIAALCIAAIEERQLKAAA